MTFSPRSFPLACVVLFLCPWAAKSVDVSLHGAVGRITGGGDGSFAAKVTVLPSQSKCWVEAIKIFQPTDERQMQTTTEICAEMGQMQQKALAFELARCHLQDLGREMIETIVADHVEDLDDCLASANDENEVDYLGERNAQRGTHFPNLSKCLSSLTDVGANTYTQFFAQVVSLCHRLTEHLVIGFQQHTAMELARVSQQTVDFFTDSLKRQQDSFYEHEAEMRQKHEDFYQNMRDHEKSIREDFTTQAAGIFDSWKAQNQEQSEMHSALFRAWEDKTAELEQQYHQKLDYVNRILLPIFSFDTLIALAMQIYRLLAITLHGMFILFICLLLTRPRCSRRARGTLFACVLMETIAEVCVHFLIHNLVSEDQKQSMVVNLRHAAMSLEIIIYIGCIVVSCCWCPFGENGGEEDGMDEEDEIDEDGGSETPHGNRNNNEVMRSEFRQLMVENAARSRMDPSTLSASTAFVQAAHRRGPPGTTPLGSHSTATFMRHHDSNNNPLGIAASRNIASTAARASGTNRASSIFRSSDAPTPNVGSQATTKVAGASRPHAAVRQQTLSNNEGQDSKPVADVRPKESHNAGGAQSGRFAEWRKRRTQEEVDVKDGSESESEESERPSPSPSSFKRRRVEIVEEEKKTEEGPVDEDAYLTAAEDAEDGFEDEHSTDNEDSDMDDAAEEPEIKGQMDETE